MMRLFWLLDRYLAKSSQPPGPPPRPGLVWKPETSRWIRPKEASVQTGRKGADLKVVDDAFRANNKKLFLVGGAVRDILMGREPKDFDFTSDARPDEIKRILGSLKGDIYTVGERFGTIGYNAGGQNIEITTFRDEKYNPQSRKPEVTFGDSLEEDLARRDFTINAMAKDPDGGLHDPFNGQEDIKNQIIRAVGNPDKRFEEDPLRMLRAVRFAARYGFRIEDKTLESIKRNFDSMRHISKERIAQETNSILISDNPRSALQLLVDTGLMRHIVPELYRQQNMHQSPPHHKDVLGHTIEAVGRIPGKSDLRWAALLHDIGKPATKSVDGNTVHFLGHEDVGSRMVRQILGRLRFKNEFIDKVSKMVALHMRPNLYTPKWSDGAVRRLMREAGDIFPDLLQLSRADITSARAQKVAAAIGRVDDLERRAKEIAEKVDIPALSSPLDGNELQALFDREPGRWIYRVKNFLTDKVIDGALAADDKKGAEQLAREFVQQEGV